MDDQPQQQPQLGPMDKIQILLSEYTSLRTEVIHRTTNFYQIIGLAVVLFGLMVHQDVVGAKFRITVAVSVVVIGIFWFLISRDLDKLTRRLREIEADVNARAGGEPLLLWETRWGGVWATIFMRPKNPARLRRLPPYPFEATAHFLRQESSTPVNRDRGTQAIAENQGGGSPSPNDLWKHLNHVVAYITTTLQTTWTSFGIFSAANAVVLAALVKDGHLPERRVGLIVSLCGVALSLVWLVIQHRMLAWLGFYESIMAELQGKLLGERYSLSPMGHWRRIGGVPVRPIMILGPALSAIAWSAAAWWFSARC
jgi:hypothetical protein